MEIKEAIYQCAPYVGLERARCALEEVNAAFKEAGVSLPTPPQGSVTEEDRFEKGLDVQRYIFGLSLIHISLWDVLCACARRGSLDSAIRDPQVNDFAAFFAAHPGITRVLFNGAAAEKLFFRFCGEALQGRAAARLPSTSPAYTLPYAQKLEIWRKELLR